MNLKTLAAQSYRPFHPLHWSSRPVQAIESAVAPTCARSFPVFRPSRLEWDSGPHRRHRRAERPRPTNGRPENGFARSTVSNTGEFTVGGRGKIGIIGIPALNGLARWLAAQTRQTDERPESWKTSLPEFPCPPAHSEATATPSVMGSGAESSSSTEDIERPLADGFGTHGSTVASGRTVGTPDFIVEQLAPSIGNEDGGSVGQKSSKGGLS